MPALTLVRLRKKLSSTCEHQPFLMPLRSPIVRILRLVVRPLAVSGSVWLLAQPLSTTRQGNANPRRQLSWHKRSEEP